MQPLWESKASKNADGNKAMINKEELMIGNIVRVPMNESWSQTGIEVVDSISYEGINETRGHGMDSVIKFSNITPIEINDKILEFLGFVKDKSNCEELRDTWSIQVANTTSLYYDEKNDKSWYLSYEYNNNHFQNDFWNKPVNLHQLQNLLLQLKGFDFTLNPKEIRDYQNKLLIQIRTLK